MDLPYMTSERKEKGGAAINAPNLGTNLRTKREREVSKNPKMSRTFYMEGPVPCFLSTLGRRDVEVLAFALTASRRCPPWLVLAV